jgi:pimeloyl-ACP methyl ester carboxylesterase
MLQRYPERILTATLVGSPAMVIGETWGPWRLSALTCAGWPPVKMPLIPRSMNSASNGSMTPEPTRFLDLASRLAARQSFEIDPADSAGRRAVMVIRAGKDALIPPDGFTRLAERIRAGSY